MRPRGCNWDLQILLEAARRCRSSKVTKRGLEKSKVKDLQMLLEEVRREAAWMSYRGRWIWNLEVPGSNPPPYCYLDSDLFTVFPSSTPRPRCANSQLVNLPSVGILNSLCSFEVFSHLDLAYFKLHEFWMRSSFSAVDDFIVTFTFHEAGKTAALTGVLDLRKPVYGKIRLTGGSGDFPNGLDPHLRMVSVGTDNRADKLTLITDG